MKIDEDYTKPADTETDKYIYVGETLEIEGTDAAYHRWTYDEGDVLSVSVEKSKRAETNKATVTGLKVGDVTLKHESSDASWFWPVTTDTITVHVIKKAPASSLTISGPDTVEQGKNITLTTDAETDVTWTSSDPSIATIDANGKVVGVKEGTVTITATTVTAEGKVLTATHDVKVTKSTTSGKYNAKFTSTIENADVVYFNWHNASDVSEVSFTPATSSFTVNDYTTETASGYVVFFVKPNSNHIITGLGASGAGQMYAVDATSWGAINGYPGISTVMAAAKAEGYVAAFGYSRGPKSNMAQSFEVRAKSPDMLIAATSSQTEGVAAGDELTFTVTITPQTTGSGKDHATGVKVNSAEVNGTEVTVEDLTQNSDGTYTGYVHYTATDNDCNRGSVVLSVEATTTYEGTFTITSGGITTGAEVTKSATCACQIAPESQVKYQFVSGTTGMALPSAINDFLPWDNSSYAAGKKVKAKDPSQKEYADSKNDGYWTFDGWDHDSVETKRSGETVTFTGTWTFTKYSKYTINYVDENGNKIAESKTVGQKKVGDKVKASEVEKPEIEGYTYSKTSSDITIAADESKNVITVTYKQKAGKAGYNLVLADASWAAPEKTTNTEKMKWYYDYGFAKDDTFTVTDSEPAAADHVFIGWMDKKRDGQAAAIRKAGETVTYCYSNNQTYTLDALWASLSATGEDVTYDGRSHTVTVDVKINDGTGLDAKYVEQAKKLIAAGTVQYSTDGGETWSAEKPSFKDAGTYTVQVKQDVTVGGVTTTLTAETQVKIAQKEYFVKTNTESKTYDGSELVGTAAVEGLVAGESATATATTVGPNVTASITNAVTGEIVWAEGTNPSNYKRGNDQLGTLEITKRAITVNATDSKRYTGAQQSFDIPATAATNLADGETLTLTGATIYGTELGSYTSVANDYIWSVAKGEDGSVDSTGNYTISVTGELTITAIPASEGLTITPSNKSYVYDSDSHYAAEATATASVAGTAVTLEYRVKGSSDDEWRSYDKSTFSAVKAGTLTLQVRASAPNYVGYAYGEETLTITKRPVELKTKSATKVYDGTALTTKNDWDRYEIGPKKDGGFIFSDLATGSDGYPVLECTGSQTKVGSSSNTIKYKIKSDRVDCYEVAEPVLGTLTVTAKPISDNDIKATAPDDVVYDGQQHQLKPTVKFGKTVLKEGEDYDLSWSEDITNAGTVTVTITGKGNYSGARTVEYKITPRPVALKSNSRTWTYDGAEHSDATVNVTSELGFVDGEVSDLTANGVVSTVAQGEVANSITFTKNESYKDANYSVTLNEGKLQISGKDLNAQGMSVDTLQSVVYNGLDQKQAPEVKDGETVLTEGTDYTVEYSKDVKNVGTVTVTVKGKGNYTGTVTKTYKITKRQVTLTSDSGSKNYDGKPITRHGVTVSGDGFAKGENMSQNYTWFDSDFIEPGTYTNKFEYQLKNGTDAKNYEIKTVFGELTINKASANKGIKLTARDASKKYDGQPLEAAAATAEAKVSGNAVKVEYSVDGENWTEDSSTITATNVADSETVYVRASSKNYEGYATAKAKLEVTKRSVKLVGAKNVSKVYDGKELTAPEVEVKGDGFVEGEATDIKATGSVTDVTAAPVANPITFTKGEGFKAGNYSIETDPGTLEVTARSIDDADYGMDVSTPVDVEYDGLAHEWAPVVKDGELTLTKDRDYTVTYTRDGEEVSDFTNVTGTITVTITGMGNYTGSVTRTYEITPAPLKIATEGASKVYDGEALTNDVATVDGLKNGETLTIHAVGAQVEVGESDNGYELAWDGTAVESNYSIASEEIGKLVVTETAEQIVATPLDVTVQYDGQAHGTTVQVSSLPKGYTLKSASSKASATNVADGDVTAEVDDLVIVNAEGEDVTSKLDIVRNTATIRITPAPLRVTTGSATKVYDGTALTNSDLKIEGLVGSDSVTAKTTGSRTQVGTAENGYEISWTDADEQNYSITEQLGTLTVTAAPSDNGNGDNGGTTPTPVNPTNNNGGNGNNGGAGGNGVVNTIARTLVNGYNAVTGNNAAVDAQGTAQAAAQDEEQIFDSENPLGRFEHNELTCWVHWYMILCCAATILYGMFVGVRRNKQTMSLERSLKSILGGSDGSQK